MYNLPDKLYHGVASGSPHHREAQNYGTCTPKGGDAGSGFPNYHTKGATDTSRYTSWTAHRLVAEGYARSHAKGGVVLEINFRTQVAISNEYFYQGDRLGEDEYLVEGKIHGVRVTPVRKLNEK